MVDVTIPGEVLERANLSPNEFLIEVATYLYDKEILSIGQAKEIAGLDLISFQRELSAREIAIKYDYSDYLEDMKNLENLD